MFVIHVVELSFLTGYVGLTVVESRRQGRDGLVMGWTEITTTVS